jgi:DNA processing protein
MWTQPMSRNRRTGAAPRQKYSPPDRDNIRQTTFTDLLSVRGRASKGNPQEELRFDQTDNLPDRPVWCVGNMSLLQRPCVAIVGTRTVSDLGAARARRLAKELTEQGIVVVSGLARGVDTEALTAAMSAGGSVVAVIGTPVDRAYPNENASIQEQIAKNHLLISQYAPGSRTFVSHFPERNRLMAAVSDATVIIEAGDTSGTLHQAAECVRLGRWLFIAKNVMEDPALEWPAKLRDYANVRTLTDSRDVLGVLQ